MTRQNFDINKLRVASPCSVGWETMAGDERKRFCNSCNLNVYNISEMTANEVQNLIADSEGRICGRLYRRTDGTILTKDCPVGFRAYYKRSARFAGAALSAILGLFSVSFAQKAEDKTTIDASKAKIVRTMSQKTVLRGKIIDPQGAAIPGIEIKLYRRDSAKDDFLKTVSNADGEYKFEELPAGIYTLETSAINGFSSYKAGNIEIEDNRESLFDITLNVLEFTTGIIIETPLTKPLIDTKSSGVTTKITREMIDKVPH